MKLADEHTPPAPFARARRHLGAAALASGALIAAATLAVTGCSSGQGTADSLALAGATSATGLSSDLAGSYQIVKLNDARDETFNQLLGINNQGIVVGYFGSGAAGHPNKGYTLFPLFSQQHSYWNENFPGAAQTQVTGLNDNGVTVGFWSTQNTASMTNNNFGFYRLDGRFYNVNFPVNDNASRR
jgi:hypothetical protein